jgi:hypothetical protein
MCTCVCVFLCAGAASSNGVPPATSGSSGYDEAAALKAKQEAQAWIAAWKAKQAAAKK